MLSHKYSIRQTTAVSPATEQEAIVSSSHRSLTVKRCSVLPMPFAAAESEAFSSRARREQRTLFPVRWNPSTKSTRAEKDSEHFPRDMSRRDAISITGFQSHTREEHARAHRKQRAFRSQPHRACSARYKLISRHQVNKVRRLPNIRNS